MDDKELANAVVRVLPSYTKDCSGLYKFQWEAWGPNHNNTAFKVVRDWRVAGALMEALHEKQFSYLVANYPGGDALVTVQSPLPNKMEWAAQVVNGIVCRAIIEASVVALTDTEDHKR